MGCSNGKQHDENDNNKKQPPIKKRLRFSSSRKSKLRRPVTYGGIISPDNESQASIRSLSMYDNVDGSEMIYLTYELGKKISNRFSLKKDQLISLIYNSQQHLILVFCLNIHQDDHQKQLNQ